MALKDWFKSVTGSYFRKDKQGTVFFHKKGEEIEAVATYKFEQLREFFKTKNEANKFAIDFMKKH